MRKLTLALSLAFLALPAWATNWYVSTTSTGAANGTSWTNAWSIKGIPWGSVKPGDTVYLDGGATSLTYTTPLTIGASGISGSPVTIAAGRDSGHSGVVIFDGGGGTSAMISVGGHQYVTIDGNYGGARHILLQNNNRSGQYPLISGSGGGCSTFPCSESSFLHGVRITYVEVKQAGNGINVNYPYGIEIDHDYIHDISCDHAIGVNGSADFMSGALWGLGAKIHDNIIQVNNTNISNPNVGTGPDAITATNGVDVYNNTIYGAEGTNACSQHQDGVQWAGNYYRVYGNTFYCLANSVSEGDQYDKTNHTAADGHYWFYNNVIGQCAGQSNSHGWETVVHTSGSGSNLGVTDVTDYHFWNNTVTDLTGFVFVRLLGTSGVTLTNSSIVNNIAYNDGALFDLSAGNYTCGKDFVIDSNNVYGGGSSSSVCDGAAYASGVGTNAQKGSPSFVRYTEYAPGTNDLHLTSSSTPDIGTGSNLSTYFTTDKDGNTRPGSGYWDLGAYQLSSKTSSTTSSGPPPPTGLTATPQ